jgi:hypothetical protein
VRKHPVRNHTAVSYYERKKQGRGGGLDRTRTQLEEETWPDFSVSFSAEKARAETAK